MRLRRIFALRFSLLAPFLAPLFSCGSSSQQAPPVVPLSEFEAKSLKWGPCPDDLGGASVDCTQAEVPLDWTQPDGHKTSVLVRRISAEGVSEGSLWLLDGGPGFAGDSFLDPGFLDVAHEGNLDIFVPSHRGSIGPSALTCPSQQDQRSSGGGRIVPGEWRDCLAALEGRWGEGLPPFTVRQSALDLAHLMGRAGSEGRTLVFGGSYGSLWAHRLLLDTDASPDAVLLDSIVPIGASLERVDAHADAAIEEVLTSCAELPACAERFEGAPVEASRAAIAKYAEGAGCGQATSAIERESVQLLAHSLLQGPPDAWVRIVALFERLVRCNEADRADLVRILEAPAASTTPESAGSTPLHYSLVLNRHLLYRELYRFDETDAERAAFEASALALGPQRGDIREEAAVFGEGYRALETAKEPTTDVRTFLLSGRLDPLDPPPWADDFRQTLTEGTLVSIPWAGHSTLRYLGWGEGECGRTVFSSFVASGTPDVSCVKAQEAPDLAQAEDATREMIAAWIAGDR